MKFVLDPLSPTGVSLSNATTVITGGGGSNSNAILKTETSTEGMGFVLDEDNMASNSATKVPTQQSVKTYVDTSVQGSMRQRSLGAHPFFTVIANTTAETKTFSTYAIPAGLVKVSDMVGFTFTGMVTNNTGGDVTFTFRLKFGSVVTTWTAVVGTSASQRAFTLSIDGIIVDFLGLRIGGAGTMIIQNPSGASEVNPITQVLDVNPIPFSTGANLDFTAQMSAASADASVNVYSSLFNLSTPIPA